MHPFQDEKEFRTVFDLLFTTLSRDPEVGPRLRASKTPQRFVFTDADLVLNVAYADEAKAKKGDNLVWVWGDAKRKWEPAVTLRMTTAVANRYFQGRENVPLDLARKSIVLESGDVKKVLDLLPIVLPFHKTWIATLKSKKLNHLLV